MTLTSGVMILLLLTGFLVGVVLFVPFGDVQASPQDSFSNQRDPTACEAVGDNWTNCDNAFVSDNAYAFANGSSGPGPIQFARPDSDITVGGWTITPLFQKLDEVTRSDADFITSPIDPSSPTNDVEIGLSGVTDPATGTGHTLRYTFRFSGAGSGVTLTVQLRQGATIIASFDEGSITNTAFIQRDRTLTTAQADSITDYNDLRIRYLPGTVDEDEEMEWSWCEFEVPGAPLAGGNDTAWMNYGFSLNVTDTIEVVEVGIEAFRISGTNVTNVTVSADGGVSWAANQTATSKASDDDTLEFLNFTSYITWRSWDLSDANFRARAVTNGSGLRLDYLPVRVNFTTHTSTEADFSPSNCKAYQTANWTLCDNGFVSDNVYAYANGSSIQGAVVSVETFQVFLDGIATDFRELTQGQDIANTVSFLSKSISGIGASDFWNRFAVEATFTDTPTKRVVLTRNNPTGNLTVYVTVVEFNPSIIKVQTGTFSLTTSTTPVIPEAVVLAKTALLFYYQSTDGTDDHNDNRVRGRITSTTQLTFNVDGTTGTKSGTWWVLESLDTTWDVQTADLTFASSATSATGTITSVDVAKSFLITSWDTSEPSDDSRGGALQVNLTDSTTVTGTRPATPAATLDAHVFVVTFSGDEKVQRHDMSMTALSHTDTIDSVDLSVATLFATTHDAEFPVSGTSSPIDDSFVRFQMTDSTTVQGDRADQANDGTITWQVIEWVTTSTGGNDTEWLNFGISLTEEIFLVKVGVEWFRTSAQPILQVTISFDGNTTWAANQTATNKSSDDDTLEFLDFTNATDWDGSKLEDGNLTVRAHTNASDGRLDHIIIRVLSDAPPADGATCEALTVVITNPSGQLFFNAMTDTPVGGLWQEENVSEDFQTASAASVNVTNDDTVGVCDVTLELLTDPGTGRTMKFSTTSTPPDPGINTVPFGSNVTVISGLAIGATVNIWLWIDLADSQGGQVTPTLRVDTKTAAQ